MQMTGLSNAYSLRKEVFKISLFYILLFAVLAAMCSQLVSDWMLFNEWAHPTRHGIDPVGIPIDPIKYLPPKLHW